MTGQLAEMLLRYTQSQTSERSLDTAIEGMAILRSDHPKPPNHMIFRPALCIVAQGSKMAAVGGKTIRYHAGQALVVGLETPLAGRVVEASEDEPCLVLVLKLDLSIMRDLADELETPSRTHSPPGSGVFVTDFQGPLADCAVRLVRLLDTPKAIPTLYPVIMREICYWLLTGPHGGDVARLVLKTSPSQPLIRAVHNLRDRFREMVRIEELAEIARLSPSAFHRQFKILTLLTPLQYQKQLRLIEARRLMLAGACNAETAAFEVGYESASQFSREYARTFGAPPKRDLQRLQDGASNDQMMHGPRAIAPSRLTQQSSPQVAS